MRPRMAPPTLPAVRAPSACSLVSQRPVFRLCLSKQPNDGGYALKKVVSTAAVSHQTAPAMYVFSKSSASSATGNSGDTGLMYVHAARAVSSTNMLSSTAVPCNIFGAVGVLAAQDTHTVNNTANHLTSHVDEGRSTGDVASMTVLRVDITNVWFGTARSKPVEPVVITKIGFSMMLRNDDKDMPFVISYDKIIRCATYFGNARKHTLFLFVLPNCTRRLAPLGDKYTASSLIVMFLPALSQRQVTELVYLFWRMGRRSIFGELFCEIYQKAALSLLSNIKPAIMCNVSDHLRDIAESELSAIGDEAAHMLGHCYTSAAMKPRLDFDDDRGGLRIVTADNDGLADEQEEVDCKPQNLEELLANGSAAYDDDVPFVAAATRAPFHARINSCKVGAVSHAAEKRQLKSGDANKRLRIKFPPAILKRKMSLSVGKTRADSQVRVVQPNNNEVGGDSNEIGDDDNHDNADGDDDDNEGDKEMIRSEQELGDGEQYTIIQWDANNDSTATTTSIAGDSGSSNSAENDSHQTATAYSDGENDLEIVCPNESDDDLTPDTQGGSDDNEDGVGDLVMTKEKINTRCPITQEIMKHPMKNKHCGHSYDRRGVEELIRHRGNKARCPVTGCSNTIPLKMNDFKQNYSLWQYINGKTKRQQPDSE